MYLDVSYLLPHQSLQIRNQLLTATNEQKQGKKMHSCIADKSIKPGQYKTTNYLFHAVSHEHCTCKTNIFFIYVLSYMYLTGR